MPFLIVILCLLTSYSGGFDPGNCCRLRHLGKVYRNYPYSDRGLYDPVILILDALISGLGQCRRACHISTHGSQEQDGAGYWNLCGQCDSRFHSLLWFGFESKCDYLQQISSFVIPLLVVIGWM